MTTHRVLPYGRQTIDEADKQAVLAVLGGDWLTQGPLGEEFERALRQQLGVEHASTCANGTAALHLAALALNWGPGDVVIVPAITFLASANCARYVGAEPYCVDVEDATLTIDLNEVEKAIKLLRAQGRTVRGVVAVDMAGHAADWPSLRALADRYDLKLIDDACHALGGTYANGVKIGSCAHADMTALSFHPVKHITTGEGGAVLTNDRALGERVARLRTHGIVRGEHAVADWEGPWHGDQIELGYNYRLTDIQSALGLSQIAKLDSFVARRREIARLYDSLFAEAGLLRTPVELESVKHAYPLYVARAQRGGGRPSRRELFEAARQQGIQLQVHYRPIVSNTYYRDREFSKGAIHRLPVSFKYYDETMSLPMFPQLTDDDVVRVVGVIEGLLGGRIAGQGFGLPARNA
jgi:UDP-4-amino-4,6-dideoxy-N-acetyl-beta-L-altrosamine transaminase